MYLIRNKALDDNKGKLTVSLKKALDEETIIRLCEQFEIPIRVDMQTEQTNWKIQTDLLKSRLAVNWATSPAIGDKFKLEANAKIVKETTNIQEYFETYESEGLGIYNLLPGDETEIRYNKKYAEALINSGFADKIKITDLETDQVIWDGGQIEFEYSSNSFNYEGKKVVETFTGKKIGNLVHPKKERVLFIKAKKEVKEPAIATVADLLPQTNELGIENE
jgi:hypothetical protein